MSTGHWSYYDFHKFTQKVVDMHTLIKKYSESLLLNHGMCTHLLFSHRNKETGQADNTCSRSLCTYIKLAMSSYNLALHIYKTKCRCQCSLLSDLTESLKDSQYNIPSIFSHIYIFISAFILWFLTSLYYQIRYRKTVISWIFASFSKPSIFISVELQKYRVTLYFWQLFCRFRWCINAQSVAFVWSFSFNKFCDSGKLCENVMVSSPAFLFVGGFQILSSIVF